MVAAPGYLEQRSRVTLAEGGTQELAIELKKDPDAALSSATPAPTPTAVVVPSTQPSDTASKKNSNTLAYVALGVGGAGLVVGGITGFLALGEKSDLDGCVGDRCPSSERDTLDSAKSMATVSTVGFAVGFVGVGVGVVLLLTGNDSRNAALVEPRLARAERRSDLHVEPWIGNDAAGLRGTF